ncbi:MAG: helix-turn-helix domain-containing protein, partial [Prevotellaceae bacterium]|nr:helix-turn-helix domain-containing protein [Prevotellaceae bacterium]
SQELATNSNQEEPKEVARQVHYIFRRFAEMLSQDNGMHRSVTYYADALCYSPKHFSKVIKQASGHTPIELINKAAMEHIKFRLKHSEKSIKEIAEEFNFSNQSFFGKYVKAHLGMSPAQYRDQK